MGRLQKATSSNHLVAFAKNEPNAKYERYASRESRNPRPVE